MIYSDKIIRAFYNDCGELVNNLEEKLLLLEKTPENKNIINEVFRLAHSIKSESGLMGFHYFSALAHKMEDIFHLLRDGKIYVNDGLLDVFLRTTDRFKNILNKLNQTGKEVFSNQDLIDRLSRIEPEERELMPEKIKKEAKKLDISKEDIEKAIKQGFNNLFLINVKLFDNVALKYAKAFLVYNNLTSAGSIIKASVDFQKQQSDDLYLDFSILIGTNKSENEIYDLADVSEVERISVKGAFKSGESITGVSEDKQQMQSIRVDVSKVDSLMSYVGELIVNYNRLEKVVPLVNAHRIQKGIKTEFNEVTTHLKRIIGFLQDDVMKIRMVPLKTLFDKIPRLIRELSRKLDKQVMLDISGEYTEIDKTVIEQLRDPLIHIIRNAIDHGIETSMERHKKGKNDKGQLTINSYQSGNKIIIEVADDGKGLDKEKIMYKAIQMGLVNKEKMKDMQETDIYNFIFEPGFSTSEDVSDLSGRGVGMDVVKKNIEELQGKMQVLSRKDQGTRIIISLPLTLAIVKALIVKVSDLVFAVPLYFVEETLRIYHDQIRSLEDYEVIELREHLVALVFLRELLGKKRAALRVKNRYKYFVIIVKYNNKKVGLVVDFLVTEQDIVIKPLSGYIEDIRGASGVTILGDGTVAYILDPPKMIESYIKSRKKVRK
ncbi:MAG: chemotaxis protein CheA [Spirochaetes bacterium]|nr:chemotaxis protein CheA [Spirochaetota bacterium]